MLCAVRLVRGDLYRFEFAVRAFRIGRTNATGRERFPPSFLRSFCRYVLIVAYGRECVVGGAAVARNIGVFRDFIFAACADFALYYCRVRFQNERDRINVGVEYPGEVVRVCPPWVFHGVRRVALVLFLVVRKNRFFEDVYDDAGSGDPKNRAGVGVF